MPAILLPSDRRAPLGIALILTFALCVSSAAVVGGAVPGMAASDVPTCAEADASADYSVLYVSGPSGQLVTVIYEFVEAEWPSAMVRAVATDLTTLEALVGVPMPFYELDCLTASHKRTNMRLCGRPSTCLTSSTARSRPELPSEASACASS